VLPEVVPGCPKTTKTFVVETQEVVEQMRAGVISWYQRKEVACLFFKKQAAQSAALTSLTFFNTNDPDALLLRNE